MVWQAYSSKSFLYFGEDDIINSTEGVQQGDPLGPFLFSLGIRDLMRSCESPLSIWYLDDGTVCGKPETVHADLRRILAASDSLGLSVNAGKCEVFTVLGTEDTNQPSDQEMHPNTTEVLSRIEEDAPRIRKMRPDNLLLLGAPMLEEAIEGVLLSKLDDLKRMSERLTFIDTHDAIFLLRNCYAIPRLTYFMRSAPCFKTMATLRLYDQELKRCLKEVLNTDLSDLAWDQSSLPVKQGGLGIRKASDLALPAFLSSA